jgi:hypothetical protein
VKEGTFKGDELGLYGQGGTWAKERKDVRKAYNELMDLASQGGFGNPS